MVSDIKCNTDYYIVFADKNNFSLIDFIYLQVTIIRCDTKIININPLLSDYFVIAPIIKNKKENLFYCFIETKYFLIQFIDGNLILYEDNNIIYKYRREALKKIFEFKKDKNYTIFYDSSLSLPIYIQFYQFDNETIFFKHDIKKTLLFY